MFSFRGRGFGDLESLNLWGTFLALTPLLDFMIGFEIQINILGNKKVKNLFVNLIVIVSLPIAFMAGCGNKSTSPSSPGAPTETPTITSTPTITGTPTLTGTPTITRTPTETTTITPTPTITSTPTVTQTPTSTGTPTETGIATRTATPAGYSLPQPFPPAMVNLGSAANYVILSYTGITNSGPSTTCGGYGVYPDGETSITGSPAIVEICGGAINVGDSAADTAKLDLGTAYTHAMGLPMGATLPPGADIGGQTLYPGVYSESGDLNISSADLTLDAQGNSSAVFVFQVKSGGDLIVGPGRNVILTGDAQAANVFWAVSGYCSLNTTVSFVGNIMAYTSVTLNTGAVLKGRALASNGDVTLLSNTITHP